MTKKTLILTLSAMLLLLTAACDLPFGIGDAWIEGEWVYRATNLAGGGMACDIENLVVTFDQQGSSFSGDASGGTIKCRGADAGETIVIDAAPITDGRVEGGRVRFNLGTDDLRHTATITERSMTGTVVWRRDLSDSLGVVVLTGRFAAARPPNIQSTTLFGLVPVRP